jgi:selenide,water dikinase
MNSSSSLIYRDLVLVGGGYAHLLFIRSWCMQPVAGIRVTLISPLTELAYSGMLPGYIGGEYSYSEIHIDVVRLCQRAGVRLVLDTVLAIDNLGKKLTLKTHSSLSYDILSLNTGSASSHDVPGVNQYAISLKPVALFIPLWLKSFDQLQSADKSIRICLVGGGAGAVESILGMSRHCASNESIKIKPIFTLVSAEAELLPGYPRKVANQALEQLNAAGVSWLGGHRITRVQPKYLFTGSSFSEVITYDLLFWCTEATAPSWLRETNLACDEDGFLKVNSSLQSISDPDIFGAGDIISFPNPLAKAGVFSVRESPVLKDNLLARLLDMPLKEYRPQTRFLTLLQLGEDFSSGAYGPVSISGHWVYRWKKAIDISFMKSLQMLYQQQEKMTKEVHGLPHALMKESIDPMLRCAGCGGKLGGTLISSVLTDIQGTYTPEDAAIIQLPGQKLVQSTDLIRAPINDAWLFGRIATQHAMNDLLAMGVQPHSLQVGLTLPYAAERIQRRDLHQLLSGINSVCKESNTLLTGGHSAEGSDLLLCLTVNGNLPEDSEPLKKSGLKKGDLLVLNKPLGSGVILAAHMQGLCPGPVLSYALDSMQISNLKGSRWLIDQGQRCCTDLSGFGLLGHLAELLQQSCCEIELTLDSFPLLPGAQELATQGIASSLLDQNRQYVDEFNVYSTELLNEMAAKSLLNLLLDPQTSGGLLAGISPELKTEAEKIGFRVIGKVI